MAKKTKPDPFVLKLLQALAKASKGKPPQTWISVDDLGLKPDHLDATIARAVDAGWISAGGKPSHSVTITASGHKVLEEFSA
ncbi:MAG: hypothetical protein WCK17_16005 [Verrucomicrobiota bacterium]